MALENVRLSIQPSYVIMDNGILKLTISKPSGLLAAIQFGGMGNLLDTKLKETQRGYWDLNWNIPGGQGRYQLLRGVEFSVINSSNNCVEVSFWAEYHSAANGVILPLSVDIRYIVRSGISGFYCYSIYERVAGLPGFDLVQTRMVFKLRRDKFHYMAISDEKQRIMPSLEDIFPPRGKMLALPESVLLVNPINPALRGQAAAPGHLSNSLQLSCYLVFLSVANFHHCTPPYASITYPPKSNNGPQFDSTLHTEEKNGHGDEVDPTHPSRSFFPSVSESS